MSLQNKIDFAIIFSVKKANPNGDPLNGNRPRTDYDGYGEVSDVCLKRKIRDRLQDAGEAIFVQSDDRNTDGMRSLKERAEMRFTERGLKATAKDGAAKDRVREEACKEWIDVRAFGQLFAWNYGKGDGNGVSIPIRGPVTIQSAFSVEPVADRISSIQITKSVSGEGDGSKRGSDTMGMKHRVDQGVYVAYGAMSPQLAERTHFSHEDAMKIKQVLPRLFEGDASSARPEGSMAVEKVIWWEHGNKSGQYSSAKVHRSLTVHPDGSYTIAALEGLTPEEIDGF